MRIVDRFYDAVSSTMRGRTAKAHHVAIGFYVGVRDVSFAGEAPQDEAACLSSAAGGIGLDLTDGGLKA